MPKVLFIYENDNKFPLGIAYLASVLRKEGIDVHVFMVTTDHNLAAFLDGHTFDVIYYSFTGAHYNIPAKARCKIINDNKKTAWLVLSGDGPSPIPDFILKETRADMVLVGAAEETLPLLLFCRKVKGKGIEDIPNLVLRTGNTICSTFRRGPLLHLDRFPYPAWDLFAVPEVMQINTSRGDRVRSISEVVKEMATLYALYGIDKFEIDDETFVQTKTQLQEFRNELLRYNLKIKYRCNAEIDTLNADMLILLKATGCQTLTLFPKTLDQNKTIEMAKQLNIAVELNLLWNRRGDNVSTLRESADYIKRYHSYKQVHTIKPVTPYPGSKSYFQALADGLLTGPREFFQKFIHPELITINFMEISETEAYHALFEINRELILDYYAHTSQNPDEAMERVEHLYSLYFEGAASGRD